MVITVKNTVIVWNMKKSKNVKVCHIYLLCHKKVKPAVQWSINGHLGFHMSRPTRIAITKNRNISDSVTSGTGEGPISKISKNCW
jgi:hypothetical protein